MSVAAAMITDQKGLGHACDRSSAFCIRDHHHQGSASAADGDVDRGDGCPGSLHSCSR